MGRMGRAKLFLEDEQPNSHVSCFLCDELVPAAQVDEHQVCVFCAEKARSTLADADGQPSEQEEWRDYDPDC